MVKQKAGDYVDEKTKFTIAALVVIFGANTGSILNAVSPSVRADAYTRTDAKALEAKLNEVNVLQQLVLLRLKNIDKELDTIRAHHKEWHK